jgi:hypothetical protein
MGPCDVRIVVAYGIKRRDFKEMRVLWPLATAGIFVPDMTRLKRCGFFGSAVSNRERLRRAKKKRFRIAIRSETEKRKEKKARSADKKGARDGTRTHVGMSKRLDLHSKEQEITSHQAALVMHRGHKSYKHQPGHGQHARRRNTEMRREEMPKGTAATGRAKGGVEGWRT